MKEAGFEFSMGCICVAQQRERTFLAEEINNENEENMRYQDVS